MIEQVKKRKPQNYTALSRVFRSKNPHYHRDWQRSNPARARESHWKRYGIKNADGSDFKYPDFQKLLEKQNHSCAICHGTNPNNPRGGDWNVDHNHITGIVRGILCRRCNIGLGMFDDSTGKLKQAISYIGAL